MARRAERREPRLDLEQVEVAQLRPSPANARVHPDEQLAALELEAAS